MSRYYRKLALLFFVLFAVVMLLIRSQPYDDHELRALLMPEGCEMPCFMGIRPGVTTVDEAMEILGSSDWVTEISYTSTKYGTPEQKVEGRTIYATWNGRQPDFIENRYSQITVFVSDGYVQFISILVKLNLADFWLSLGPPEAGHKELMHINGNFVQGTIIYNDQTFVATYGPFPCSTNLAYMISENSSIMTWANERYGSTENILYRPSLLKLIGCN